MTALPSDMRQFVEDHILTLDVQFELRQRHGPVFDAVFRGHTPRIDFKGIGLRLFTWPTFYYEGARPSVVRFSGYFKGNPVLLYFRFDDQSTIVD